MFLCFIPFPSIHSTSYHFAIIMFPQYTLHVSSSPLAIQHQLLSFSILNHFSFPLCCCTVAIIISSFLLSLLLLSSSFTLHCLILLLASIIPKSTLIHQCIPCFYPYPSSVEHYIHLFIYLFTSTRPRNLLNASGLHSQISFQELPAFVSASLNILL